jgi:hypothetical protein
VAGIGVAVTDPYAVAARWETVVGGLPGVSFGGDDAEPGIIEVSVCVDGASRDPFEVAGVRFVFIEGEEVKP